MTQATTKRGRSLLALMAVLAIAVAACGSSKTSATPGSSATPSSSASASVEPSSSGGSGGLGDAGSNFSNVNSYKFTMTILAADITGSLAPLTGGSASDPMVFLGTVIAKPEAAASITIGTLKIIEVGAKQYIDLGSGSFIATDVKPGDTSMAESFSPATMFKSFVGASSAQGYGMVGSGQKNGVGADHYQASEAALAQFGAIAGDVAEGATWASDVWIAQEGGYPVSFSAIATKAGAPVWEIIFEVTNVNDPANKVEAPAA